MKNKLTKLILASILTSCIYTLPVLAASMTDFKTDEFYAFDKQVPGSIGGLELINAVGAYEKGYTGAGVIVNVCDGGAVNLANPDFSNKTTSKLAYDNNTLSIHSTHVAGIIAAEKNNQGMHGVAFNSNIISSHADYSEPFFDALADDNIKIINNSWGLTVPIDYIQSNDDLKSFAEEVNGDIKNAIKKDKLLVFSASNDGAIGPGVPAGADFFGEEFTPNIISVGALRSSSIKNGTDKYTFEFIAKNYNDGKKSTDAIADFTDLHAFNEDNSMMAPGYHIYSTNTSFADKGQNWIYLKGTSMAAPVVSGVAALVQEAHPYLTGKQIGDVLLSTANKNIDMDETEYFVTYYRGNTENETNPALRIFYFGDKPNDAQVKKDMIDYFVAHKENLKDIFKYFDESDTEEEIAERLDTFLNNEKIEKFAFSNVHQSLYLGQGIVDAGAAVNGLGAINVHRLTKNDITTDYSLEKDNSKAKYAYYNVNTHGYDAEWSNNISEVRAGYLADNPLDLQTTATSLDFENQDADLKDLHDRYLFYTNEDNKKYFDCKDDFNLFDVYVKSFNDRVEASGLAGLSAGLIKEGAGCLTLSGQNTYKGTSVVTGGVLNITGSVAGDAWSDKAGVLAGNGTINGSVMNNSAMMAGDYRANLTNEVQPVAKMQTFGVGNKNLTIEKSLFGNGTIFINGNQDSIIEVKETADISKMQIKATETIDLEAAKNGITFLTANNVKAKEETATSEKTGNLSYLLNYEVKVNGEDSSNAKAILTVSQNEDAQLDANFQGLVTSLYNLTTADAETTKFSNRLFALDKDEALTTFTEQNNSIYADMAHEALCNRTVRTAVTNRALGSVAKDSENAKWWANMGKNWHRFGSANAHNFSIATGLDFIHDEQAYAGVMLSFSDNSIDNKNANGKYKEYGVALYAGTQKLPGKLSGYISGTRQNNEAMRKFSVMNLTAESDYHSNVLGAGVNYTYDLQFNKNANWHVLPYVAVDYAHYKASDLRESGASALGLHANAMSANYADATLGVNFKRKDADATYILGTAYRRALTGNDTDLRLYGNVTDIGYTYTSTHEGRDGFIMSAYADKQIGGNWSASASLEKAWAKGGSNLSANINLSYSF